MTILLSASTFRWDILLWVIGGITLSGLILWPLSYILVSNIVYTKVLRREDGNHWGREISFPDDPEYVAMYSAGAEWYEQNKEKKSDVHIVRDGFNLYGEYFDFGSDRCVIVLSGRTEGLTYGYFFAKPYVAAGCNVLVIDARAHGMSDGKFNTCGFEESKDALAWAKYVHDELGVKSVIFHGICIGSAAAVFALTSEDCPDYIAGMVAEGMFVNFSESMKNHLIEFKKPVFILNDMIDMWMKHYTGHSMKFGPIDVIHKLDKPLLMLHSKEDIYSVPEYAQKLYDTASSSYKKLVWFEHGRHSMLRITETPKYDDSIEQFIAECFENKHAA